MSRTIYQLLFDIILRSEGPGPDSGMKAKNKKTPTRGWGFFCENIPGDALLSHTVARVVPLAWKGLTAEFGMGSGVSPSLWSPEFFIHIVLGSKFP